MVHQMQDGDSGEFIFHFGRSLILGSGLHAWDWTKASRMDIMEGTGHTHHRRELAQESAYSPCTILRCKGCFINRWLEYISVMEATQSSVRNRNSPRVGLSEMGLLSNMVGYAIESISSQWRNDQSFND